MILFVVRSRKGGIGRFLRWLEDEEFEVWEVNERGDIPLYGYDAVVINGYMPDINPKRIKCKTIYFFHGLREVSRRTVLNKREVNPLRVIKVKRFRNWVKGFDDWLSPSFSMAERCKSVYGIEPKVVHLGINFKDIENGLRKNKIRKEDYILWVGREAWIKGFDRFMELVEMGGFRGVVVGLGGRDTENIKFLGHIPNLCEVYRKAKATVITSYYESFSLTSLESIYCGTPVYTLKSAGGSWEILQLLGLYGYGFDSIKDMCEALKNIKKFTKPDLEYFSIDKAKERLRKAIYS